MVKGKARNTSGQQTRVDMSQAAFRMSRADVDDHEDESHAFVKPRGKCYIPTTPEDFSVSDFG